MSIHALYARRSAIEAHWARFASGELRAPASGLQCAIHASWRRSARHLDAGQPAAPQADEQALARRWERSALHQALAGERRALAQLVDDGQLIAAVADPQARLLWTSASSAMRERAEAVNFCAGARWDERSVGTNAVGLALTEHKPVTVFSCEHYLSSVHDWVCYAAPIIHPRTGDCAGILDLSTTWRRHSALGQAAVVGMAQAIAAQLPDPQPTRELEIHALGQPRVRFRGQPVRLSLRQLEIICLLALNPAGLTLDQLHAVLYGDSRVTTHTLKSELSHLRKLIGGHIGSRPYRLTTPIWADFVEIWKHLDAGRADDALQLYRGALLPPSNSPELEEWRRCIDAVMADTLDHCDDTAVLIRQLNRHTEGSDMIRARLEEMIRDH